MDLGVCSCRISVYGARVSCYEVNELCSVPAEYSQRACRAMSRKVSNEMHDLLSSWPRTFTENNANFMPTDLCRHCTSNEHTHRKAEGRVKEWSKMLISRIFPAHWTKTVYCVSLVIRRLIDSFRYVDLTTEIAFVGSTISERLGNIEPGRLLLLGKDSQ